MTVTTFTLNVRGTRMVNREWSLRESTWPITLTRSLRDPHVLSNNIEIMLRDAVGLYHHDTGTYIPVSHIRPEIFPESILSRSNSSTGTNWSGKAISGKLVKPQQKERKWRKSPKPRVWDVVYSRPERDESFEKETLKRDYAALWKEVRRCAWLLWDGTYIFLRIKRPLIYYEDLEQGLYLPTWRNRARRKFTEWGHEEMPNPNLFRS